MLLPKAPEEYIQEIDTLHGKTAMHLYQVDDGDTIYLASFADIPTETLRISQPHDFLSGVARNMFQSRGGTIIEQKNIDKQGYFGIAATGEATIANIQATIKGRFYLVDHRFYQLFTVTAKNNTQQEQERFLESFKLVGQPVAMSTDSPIPHVAETPEQSGEQLSFPKATIPVETAQHTPQPTTAPTTSQPTTLIANVHPRSTPIEQGKGMMIAVGGADNRISVLVNDAWISPQIPNATNSCDILGSAFFDGDGHPWVACRELLASSDEGKTWSILKSGSIKALSRTDVGINPYTNQIWRLDRRNYTVIDPRTHQTLATYEAINTIGENSFPVRSIAFTPDGIVWFAGKNDQGSELISFDGKQWKSYGKLESLGLSVYDEAQDMLVTNQTGELLIFTGSNIYVLRESRLIPFIPQESLLTVVGGLTIAQAPNGTLWMAGIGGIWSWDGKILRQVDTPPAFPSKHVNHLVVDSQGRIWIATPYGIAVQDEKKTWHVAVPSTSGLAESRIVSLAVMGAPNLPPPQPIAKTASISGHIVLDGKTTANVTVEICNEGQVPFFTTSPCENRLFHQSTRTNEKGAFMIHNIPIGTYKMVAFRPDTKEWIDLNPLDPTNVLDPDKVIDVGDMELSSGLPLK